MQGFLIKAQSSRYRPAQWDFEADAFAIMGRAGLLFSLGIRCFFGFGILVRMLLLALHSASTDMFGTCFVIFMHICNGQWRRTVI